MGRKREKKGAKKEGLWKLTPLMKIRPERGFAQRLGKHKPLSTVPTGPAAGFLSQKNAEELKPKRRGHFKRGNRGDILKEL
jgi:hypothetical protein